MFGNRSPNSMLYHRFVQIRLYSVAVVMSLLCSPLRGFRVSKLPPSDRSLYVSCHFGFEHSKLRRTPRIGSGKETLRNVASPELVQGCRDADKYHCFLHRRRGSLKYSGIGKWRLATVATSCTNVRIKGHRHKVYILHRHWAFFARDDQLTRVRTWSVPSKKHNVLSSHTD
jgi:hypothetical protein